MRLARPTSDDRANTRLRYATYLRGSPRRMRRRGDGSISDADPAWAACESSFGQRLMRRARRCPHYLDSPETTYCFHRAAPNSAAA